jgi:GNAT superfamily N-acetyltransferase
MAGIELSCIPEERVSAQVLQECAELFSDHYGVWGTNSVGLHEGSRIRMSPGFLSRGFLFDASCLVATARMGCRLIGHACSRRVRLSGAAGEEETVQLITQLVVHADHRRLGIATKLITAHAGHHPETFACGIVSSNPYAVRALERALDRRCDPVGSLLRAGDLFLESRVPHLQGRKRSGLTVDTGFFVDHTGVRSALDHPSWKDRMGELADGHEYFALIFL